jgi:hypothetical protein
MIRRGISRKVAKLISGHKRDDVFERYNVTDESDLDDAARKIEAGSLLEKSAVLVPAGLMAEFGQSKADLTPTSAVARLPEN